MSAQQVNPKLLVVLVLCMVLAAWVYVRPMLGGSSDPADDAVVEPVDLGFTDQAPDEVSDRWQPPDRPRNPFTPVDLGFSPEDGPRLDPDPDPTPVPDADPGGLDVLQGLGDETPDEG